MTTKFPSGLGALTTDALLSDSTSVKSVVKNPIQKTFNLDLTTTRPLCTVNTAMTILRVREDDVKEMCERLDLQFSFNIASAGATKIEPRIALASIAAYQAGYRAPLTGPALEPADALDKFLSALWQHSRPSLRISEIYDAFCCSSQHALTLWREGHFGPTPASPTFGTPIQQSNNPTIQKISPVVPRAAVTNFLKQRRLP